MIGADPRSGPEGRNLLQSYSNYFIGNDPHEWRTRVPQFAGVRYANIYPGVDMTYQGNNGRIEYDFVVAPHADARQIVFSISGARDVSAVRTTSVGDLIVPLKTGEFVLHKPRLYQGQFCFSADAMHEPGKDCTESGGGRFALKGRDAGTVRIGFELPDYNRSQTLVVDPVVSFSTFLGGSIVDQSNGMALDGAGNMYLIGQTNSTDYPVVTGAFQPKLAGQSDVVVTKMSGDGSHLIYSTYLGGSGAEFAEGIAVDSSGNAYLTGETYSTDFPLVNPFQSVNRSGTGFVTKLSPDGSSLVFSTYLGGSLEGSTHAIVVDNSGEAIVVGRTFSTDFPVVKPFQAAHAADNGGEDAFLTKFSADGSSLLYSTYLGGSSNDEATGLAVDSAGSVYVAGLTFSSDFPTTPGSFETRYAANPSGVSFVAKFNASGQSLSFSTFLIGGQISGIAVNGSDNVFLTGQAGDFGFPVTAGAFQTTQGGGSSTDAFVTELDTQGASLVYSTFLGGNNSDSGSAIFVDASNHAYITGETASLNFPLHLPVQAAMYGGVPAAFVAQFNSSGSDLVFSTYLGGGAGGFGAQEGTGIAVDGAGNIYVVGSTSTPDFPTLDAVQPNLKGFQNLFVAKFLNEPAPGVIVSPASVSFSPLPVGSSSAPQPITLTNNGQTTLIVSAVTPTGDFSETNSCSAPIPANGQCTIEVTFSPTVATSEVGQLSIGSNASLVPVVVDLSGTGQDFTLGGSPATATVNPGQTANYSLSLSSVNGFDEQVSLTCTGAPRESTCTVSPNSVALNGTASPGVTVTTTAASMAFPNVRLQRNRSFFGPYEAVISIVALGILLVLFATSPDVSHYHRKRASTTIMGVVFILSLSGCGRGSSGGGIGTPPGSYILTVAAETSGNLHHSVLFTLQVN